MRPALRTALRIAARHHPACHVFLDDTVPIAGVRVCAGCAAMVAPMALSFVVTPWLVLSTAVAAVPLAAAALCFGLPQALSYVRRGPSAQRLAAKALGGLGLGTLLGTAWFWPAGPRLAALVALTLLAIAGQALRMRAIVRTCNACPWQRDWDHCPGFRADADADAAMRAWCDSA